MSRNIVLRSVLWLNFVFQDIKTQPNVNIILFVNIIFILLCA
jgi:hypothetical protein